MLGSRGYPASGGKLKPSEPLAQLATTVLHASGSKSESKHCLPAVSESFITAGVSWHSYRTTCWSPPASPPTSCSGSYWKEEINYIQINTFAAFQAHAWILRYSNLIFRKPCFFVNNGIGEFSAGETSRMSFGIDHTHTAA